MNSACFSRFAPQFELGLDLSVMSLSDQIRFHAGNFNIPMVDQVQQLFHFCGSSRSPRNGQPSQPGNSAIRYSLRNDLCSSNVLRVIGIRKMRFAPTTRPL